MEKAPISLAVLSGKGGVGKSNISLNLGIALNDLHQNILLVDCDFGLANIDILLGIAPTACLQDLFLRGSYLSDIIFPIPHAFDHQKLDLIPSASGMSTITDLDMDSRAILSEKINAAANNYDVILLDICAGISPTVLGLGSRADMRLVIITPEPTSLTDGYALMKVMESTSGIRDFHIVINQAESELMAMETYTHLSAVCEKFLGFKPAYLGSISYDPQVSASVIQQKPFLRAAAKSVAAQNCRAMAASLLQHCLGMNKAPDAPALSEMETI
jgi:ATPases involved in chromosome partitioning